MNAKQIWITIRYSIALFILLIGSWVETLGQAIIRFARWLGRPS